MQTYSLVISETRVRRWLAHYEGLLALALMTRHETAVEEAEEHVAIISMALQWIQERRRDAQPAQP
jgi:hypothetical protein